MKEYNVRITETLEKTVAVEAETPAQARDIVESRWRDSEYILDADCFQDVKFTVPQNRELER